MPGDPGEKVKLRFACRRASSARFAPGDIVDDTEDVGDSPDVDYPRRYNADEWRAVLSYERDLDPITVALRFYFVDIFLPGRCCLSRC